MWLCTLCLRTGRGRQKYAEILRAYEMDRPISPAAYDFTKKNNYPELSDNNQENIIADLLNLPGIRFGGFTSGFCSRKKYLEVIMFMMSRSVYFVHE